MNIKKSCVVRDENETVPPNRVKSIREMMLEIIFPSSCVQELNQQTLSLKIHTYVLQQAYLQNNVTQV
jgi:hypothetical protein